jgi:hypothetical protein
MLRRGNNSIIADRARKAANSKRGRWRKARGQRVLRSLCIFGARRNGFAAKGRGASSNE